jgi:hypothetical protein
VQSRDIYLGAIPFVLLQLVLVVVVIFVPQTVTVFLDKPLVVDLDKVDMPAVEDTLGAQEAIETEDLLKEMGPAAAQPETGK